MVSRQNRHTDRLTIPALYMRAKGVGSGELRAVAELWVILMVNGVTLIVWDGRCGRVGFAPAIAGSACDATVDCRIRCCSVRNGWFERSRGGYIEPSPASLSGTQSLTDITNAPVVMSCLVPVEAGPTGTKQDHARAGLSALARGSSYLFLLRPSSRPGRVGGSCLTAGLSSPAPLAGPL